MALINHFDDDEDERRYVQSERTAKLKATRAFLIIVIVIVIGLYAVTPEFVTKQALTTYNLVKLAILAFLAFGYYSTTKRYYLEQPWIDFLALVIFTVAILILISTLSQTEGAQENYFAARVSSYLGFTLLAVGVSVVANFRYFLIWSLLLTAVFIGFIFVIDLPANMKLEMGSNALMFLTIALFANWEIDRRAREIFVGRQLLDAEREKTETLLYNVLPQSVAKRLRAGEVVADAFSDISIIFIDIVGFSKLSKQLSPGHLVKLLNRFFLIADECADRYGIEKVKTIGDCYLAVSGGTASKGHGAKDAVSFACDVIVAMQEKATASGVDIKLRAGIHSGPVVGGVVGVNRLAYDYWGDTMNIASRIEGAAEPNGIAVSAATYFQCNGSHEFGSPETIALKGVGDIELYRLLPEAA